MFIETKYQSIVERQKRGLREIHESDSQDFYGDRDLEKVRARLRFLGYEFAAPHHSFFGGEGYIKNPEGEFFFNAELARKELDGQLVFGNTRQLHALNSLAFLGEEA